MQNMKLSVVLPARNEEGLIKATLQYISRYLKRKKYIYEILVVVNGSFYKTEKIVNEFKKNDKNVNLVHPKICYGLALKKCMQASIG